VRRHRLDHASLPLDVLPVVVDPEGGDDHEGGGSHRYDEEQELAPARHFGRRILRDVLLGAAWGPRWAPLAAHSVERVAARGALAEVDLDLRELGQADPAR